MAHLIHPSRDIPQKIHAFTFFLKSRIFQTRRLLHNLLHPLPLLSHSSDLTTRRTLAAEIRSTLWTHQSPAEFPLTAGKIQNLRTAARAFHRLLIPAHTTFSFWRQLGRTTRRRGFTPGRELREGCLIPATGGGLCQLSGLVYQLALDTRCEIIERHPHSRILPGSSGEQNRDATVFWNYVDLRFRTPFDALLEVELDPTHLIVRLWKIQASHPAPSTPPPPLPPPVAPPRPAPSGDCLTCGMIQCFRHPGATAQHPASIGHTAFLLDQAFPEWIPWCNSHHHPHDHWFTPLDGRRWNRSAYAWQIPDHATLHHATWNTLRRAWQARRLPPQGAARQQHQLAADAALARSYARRLDPTCRHLIISQNLLPHLWLLGTLGGRTFDVLMHRLPLVHLQHQLDHAASRHPLSPTLRDFRADPALLAAESAALAAAGRWITPHLQIAKLAGSQAWLIPWQFPQIPLTEKANHRPPIPSIEFPCSPLARKGAFELAAALRQLPPILLHVRGKANEGLLDPFRDLPLLPSSHPSHPSALVLPAWVEHQPRAALRALAAGIPVIATEACGLPPHPQLYLIPEPDPQKLACLLRAILFPTPPPNPSPLTEPLPSASF